MSSGTVGQTKVDVTTIIEHAFRRCGKLASTISGELLQSARENLFFVLSDLANRGLSLFCINKSILPITAYTTIYALPPGTVDLLQALYRTPVPVAGSQTILSDQAVLTLGDPETLDAVEIEFGVSVTLAAGMLLVEASQDGLTWYSVGVFSVLGAVAAGQRVVQDLDNSTLAQYWRVRSTQVGTVPVAITAWLNPSEIVMAKLNRDEYVMLPDKTRTAPAGSQSLQYWFDKQVNPRIWIWPVSQSSDDMIVVWVQQQIQDVGSLSGQLQLPQRWLESAIFLLACRVALEIPTQELPPGRLDYLEAKCQEHLAQAEDGENDGSPIRLQPSIRGYSA